MSATKTNCATLKRGKALRCNGVTIRRIGPDDFEVTYPAAAKLDVKPDLAQPPAHATMSCGTDPAATGEPISVTDPR